MITFLRIVTLCGLAAAIGALAYVKFRPPAAADAGPTAGPDLDYALPLGDFSFVSSTGAKMTAADCRGKVCVFACFFTCCTDTCPQISGAMARLQAELRDVKDVRLISLTVDPERDTSEKLQQYSATFGAEPDRWVFLAGPRGDVELFVVDQLKQGLQADAKADPGRRYIHSDKLTLVDREGRIRGWFSGTDPDDVNRLIQAARQLSMGMSKP